MSFIEQIEKLQKKPRGAREKILAVSVLIIMILIIAVWIQTLQYKFSQKSSETSESPIKTLWNIASNGFKSVLEQF